MIVHSELHQDEAHGVLVNVLQRVVHLIVPSCSKVTILPSLATLLLRRHAQDAFSKELLESSKSSRSTLSRPPENDVGRVCHDILPVYDHAIVELIIHDDDPSLRELECRIPHGA